MEELKLRNPNVLTYDFDNIKTQTRSPSANISIGYEDARVIECLNDIRIQKELEMPSFHNCENHFEFFLKAELNNTYIPHVFDKRKSKVYLKQSDKMFLIKFEYEGKAKEQTFPIVPLIETSFIYWLDKCKEYCYEKFEEKDIKVIRKIIINHLEKTSFYTIHDVMGMMNSYLFYLRDPIYLRQPHFSNGYLYSSLKTSYPIYSEIANIHKNSWIVKMRKDSKWQQWCF